MMTLPLAEVRNRLSALVDEVAKTHETVTITRNGVPTAVVLAIDDYESMQETFALLNDHEDRSRLAEAEESVAAGEFYTTEEVLAAMRQRRTNA